MFLLFSSFYLHVFVPLPDHPLLDVRSRALKSLVFKLQSSLLTTADLVQEQTLLVHLLEWFNFKEWACEAQVLSLLSELSEVYWST